MTTREAAQREKLAALCHEQWSGWMKYLFSKSTPQRVDWRQGPVEIPAWAVERWSRQMNTSYADLSDEEKDSDRKEADRILDILATAPYPIEPADDLDLMLAEHPGASPLAKRLVAQVRRLRSEAHAREKVVEAAKLKYRSIVFTSGVSEEFADHELVEAVEALDLVAARAQDDK